MPKKLTKKDKKNCLRKVDGETAFFVNDGKVLNSLRELANNLSKISDESYIFHAERNDFANWTKHVFGDEKLASDLSKVKTKITAAKKVSERIKYLSK